MQARSWALASGDWTQLHNCCIADISATLPFDVVLGEVEAPANDEAHSLPAAAPSCLGTSAIPPKAGDEMQERADQAQPPVPTEALSLSFCIWPKDSVEDVAPMRSRLRRVALSWRPRTRQTPPARQGKHKEVSGSPQPAACQRGGCGRLAGRHPKGPHCLPKRTTGLSEAAQRRERAWLRHLKQKRREEEPGALRRFRAFVKVPGPLTSQRKRRSSSKMSARNGVTLMFGWCYEDDFQHPFFRK